MELRRCRPLGDTFITILYITVAKRRGILQRQRRVKNNQIVFGASHNRRFSVPDRFFFDNPFSPVSAPENLFMTIYSAHVQHYGGYSPKTRLYYRRRIYHLYWNKKIHIKIRLTVRLGKFPSPHVYIFLHRCTLVLLDLARIPLCYCVISIFFLFIVSLSLLFLYKYRYALR